MTWYHAFLTYRGADGAICQLIQYDIAAVSTLHRELLVPLQAQRPFSLDGHLIPGTSAIQRLQIYQSACPFAALRLPDGSSALNHSPDTVRFLFERGIVDRVELYSPPLLLPLLRTVAASRSDHAQADSPTLRATSRPRSRDVRVYPTMWLYYVLCGYAALGNTVLTGLVRWVETGPNPTWLSALLRHDAPALAWPMLTSMLVGLGLLAMYYLVLLWRGSRWLLTMLNSSLLAVIVATNLINLFTPSMEASIPSWTVLMYVVPYLLLLGVITAITFTFATPQLPDYRADRGTQDPWPPDRPNVVLGAITLLLLFSAVTLHVQLASDYRIAYPLWLGYLLGGIVLWAVILRSQRRLVHQHVPESVHTPLTTETNDLGLPPLPSVETQMDVPTGLPNHQGDH